MITAQQRFQFSKLKSCNILNTGHTVDSTFYFISCFGTVTLASLIVTPMLKSDFNTLNFSFN